MQVIYKNLFLLLLYLSLTNTNLLAADKSSQMVYEGNFGAYLSAPPGWVYFPANANDDKLGVLALYKIEKKSINDAQITIQMIPQVHQNNKLEIQIENDKDRNLKAGGIFLSTEYTKTNSNVDSGINSWGYPTNNNFIGIVPTSRGILIVGGFSMKKNLDKETRIAVEQIIKNVKFVNVIKSK